MLHLAPCSPADLAMGQLARLAAAEGTTPRRMLAAIRDTLGAWQGLREGRQHAMELRTLMAAELAGAIERASVLRQVERQQAQGAVEALRVGVVALGERLARW